MRVLVCGGRDYRDSYTLGAWLYGIHQDAGIDVIIEGGATGADELARRFAEWAGIRCETYPADWSMGKQAGPIRNRQMLEEGRPDLVLAFCGGRGTENMVRQAERAGVRVVRANHVPRDYQLTDTDWRKGLQ